MILQCRLLLLAVWLQVVSCRFSDGSIINGVFLAENLLLFNPFVSETNVRGKTFYWLCRVLMLCHVPWFRSSTILDLLFTPDSFKTDSNTSETANNAEKLEVRKRHPCFRCHVLFTTVFLSNFIIRQEKLSTNLHYRLYFADDTNDWKILQYKYPGHLTFNWKALCQFSSTAQEVWG